MPNSRFFSKKSISGSLLVSLSLFIILLFNAGIAQADWDFGAKYAGEFMTLGADAASAALGESGIAYASGAASAYWNPAGIIDTHGGAFSAMHANRFAGIVKYDFLAAAQRFSPKEVFALTLFRLGIDDIPLTALEDPSSPLSEDNIVIAEKWTTDSEIAFIATYATQWKKHIAWGVNGKLLSKKVGNNQAFGIGFDAGARWYAAPSFTAGVKIADLTTTYLGWDTGHNELILPSASLGIMKRFHLRKLEADLTIVSDVVFRGENRRQADQFAWGVFSGETHLGLEYTIKNTLSLRGGLDTDRFTAGAGLKIGPVQADYAFQAHQGLGESHRISLSCRWQGNPLIRD